MQTAVQDCINK